MEPRLWLTLGQDVLVACPITGYGASGLAPGERECVVVGVIGKEQKAEREMNLGNNGPWALETRWAPRHDAWVRRRFDHLR